jgi:hypothetical protein
LATTAPDDPAPTESKIMSYKYLISDEKISIVLLPMEIASTNQMSEGVLSDKIL